MMTQTPSNTSSEDRRRHPYLATVLNPSVQKIVSTASVRIYHKPFGASHPEWTYSKIKGLLVFGQDRDVNGGDKSNIGQGYRLAETYWFRLIDLNTDRVVWMLRVPEVFEYQKDRPFFHIFSGSSRMFGFCFDDDDEAASFYNMVTDHIARPKSTTKGRTKSARRDKALPSRPRRVDPSTISAPAPASFVHIAHVGINTKGMIETSKDIDPAWQILVQDLQAYGVSHDVVEENVDFVEGFLAGAKLAKTRPTGTETKAVKVDLAPDKPPEKRRLFRKKPPSQ